MTMVFVGAFGPQSTYSGRTVSWDAGVFTIDGFGRTSLEALLQSGDAGQFSWASPETRAWAEAQVNDAFWGDAAGQQAEGAERTADPAAASAIGSPQPARAPFALKPWMIALAAALLLVVGVVLAWAMQPAGPGPKPGSTVNNAPVASEDSYTTGQDVQLTVAPSAGILANDSDPDGDALSVGNTAGPAHGTITVDSAGGFAYTPTAGFSGADFFTYEVTDGHERRSALVNISVTPGTKTDPLIVVPPTYSKYTEIKASVVLITIPFTGPYGTMNSYHYNCEFYASGLRTRIVEVSKSEMKTLAVHKTSGRASLVNGLVKRLESAGWTVVGKGAFWYSVKLAK